MAEQIEGLSAINDELCDFSNRWRHDGDYMRCRVCKRPQIRAYARAFSELWESTGGDWAANPWVWVIDFKRDQKHKAVP